MKFAQVKDLSDSDNRGHFGGYESFEFCKIEGNYGRKQLVELMNDRISYQVYTSELEFIQEIELWDFLYYLI